jgi:hypothetical protein
LKRGFACLLVSTENEYFTSAAVTGSPFAKRALGFRRNSTEPKSLATAISSASKPYCVFGSSRLSVVSVSNMSSTSPGAGFPLRVKGLNLSKLLFWLTIDRFSDPPRLASGFT